MKKVITAIGDETIHNVFKKSGEYEVIGKDIQYQEGILEVFEQINEIELLMMSDFLPGNYSITEIVKKIKRKKSKLTIYILCERETPEIQTLLENHYIEKIIPLKEEETFETNEFYSENDELKKEVERLKRENLKLKKEKVKYGKVIVFLGDHNVGKTSIAFMMSQMANLSRILLVDFDYGILQITGTERKEEFKKQFNQKTDVCRRGGFNRGF